MNIKEARALVESYDKLHPDYKKAVRMCVEDDKTKDGKVEKAKTKVEKPKVDV